MSDPLPYLHEYLPDATLENLRQAADAVSALPPAWTKLLAKEGGARVAETLAMWKPFEDYLPELTAKVRERLVSVDLLKSGGGRYSLLYGVQGKGRILYYEAKNPLQRRLTASVAPLWEQLPRSIQAFYALQDGWFYLASHSMGLLPAAEAFVVSDEDWDILERIETPSVDLDRSVALFTNGMSGYVCVDVSKQEQKAAFIWWSNKAPKYALDFWAVVDAWTALGLDADS